MFIARLCILAYILAYGDDLSAVRHIYRGMVC